jgi:hypothetical protein
MKKPILLSRDQFRESTFERDNHQCVFCKKPAVDAHHIIERRLFPDYGYYLNNGASVCEEHHIQCETTEISVDVVREACGITKPVLPPHLYDDQPYDKWGNPVLPNGQRLRGELFFDESVQKILAKGGFLADFTHWVKYPRTYHLPWSQNMSDDDRMLDSLAAFRGKRVIVTVKMDGENTTMYSDYYHARSVDGRHHPSRSWAKGFWSTISMDIPPEWRLCCENLYAQHSIRYTDLPSYLMGFSMWNERNVCLDWNTTLEWFELLGVTPVEVLYDGIFDEDAIRKLWSAKDWDQCEGYVMRLAEEIPYAEFRQKVGKFVRADHVRTEKHWMYGQPIEKNLLRK